MRGAELSFSELNSTCVLFFAHSASMCDDQLKNRGKMLKHGWQICSSIS